MGRTERSDLRSQTNCHRCRRCARILRASVPLVAERALIGIPVRQMVWAASAERFQVPEAM